MGGHLASAGCRVGGCAHGLQHHFVRRNAQGQGQRTVAVIGIEPVVSGAEREPGGDLDRFVSGAGDLEEDFVLPLEEDFAVVDAARGVHQAEGLDKEFRGEALKAVLGRTGGGVNGRGHEQKVCSLASVNLCGLGWLRVNAK